MATADYIISNQSGASFRTDLNNTLAAIVSNNSNSSAPATTYAYQIWVDTSANIIKIRNSANNAWINLFTTAGGVDVDSASNFAAAVTFTDDVTFDGATANIVFDKSDNAFEFAANAKAVFASDLTITHTGDHGSIVNTDGNLSLKTQGTMALQVADQEDGVNIVNNGAVTLYFDNSAKFATSSAGGTLTGNLTVSGNVSCVNLEPTNNIGPLADNKKIQFGNSGDLEIYHSGTNSLINNTTGELQLLTDGIMRLNATEYKFNNEANSEKIANFFQNGACELYFDHSKKFQTTTTGTTTTGNGVVTGQVVAAAGFSQVDNAQSLISQSSVGSATTSYFIGNQQIQTSSDRRIKENIVDTEINALSKLKKVKVVDFNWNDPSDKAINNKNARGKWTGCIAQEIVDIFPHAVNAPRPEGKEIDYNCEDLWTIQYQHLVPVLIKAVQELSDKLAALEAA